MNTNKILVTAAAFSLCLAVASSSWAYTTGAPTTGGNRLSIDDPTGGGGTGALTFDPSPGVIMAWASSEGDFALTSLNTSASLGDQNEYAVWSDYNAYYQKKTATEDTFTTPANGLAETAITGLTSPFTGGGWVAMGGSGS